MTRFTVVAHDEEGNETFKIEANSATEAISIEDAMIMNGYTHVDIL